MEAGLSGRFTIVPSMPSPQRAESELDPATAIDDRWLRAISIDLLGRPPLAPERERWLGQPLADVLDELWGLELTWGHWLDEQLYFFMLIDQFRPVGTSLDELPERLQKGTLTAGEALHRIGLSTSFDLRNPGADTFVTVVMEQFCGVEVQSSRRELEIGKGAYDGRAGVFMGSRAKSQSDVVEVAAGHKNAARFLVGREYERLTRAPMSKRDRARAGKRLHREPGAYPDLAKEWMNSEAYAERVARGAPMSNRTWVRAVHVDLGGAPPSGATTEALRSALDGLGDPAPLRSTIARMLLEADGTRAPRGPELGDAGAWVEDVFQRLLGRAPTGDEKVAFSRVASETGDGPTLVLYTLLSSPEYESS